MRYGTVGYDTSPSTGCSRRRKYSRNRYCGEAIRSDWISINPEVALQIERLPVGEWIGTVSEARFDDDGIGMSEGVLYDRGGRVGRSAKSTLNDPRP